MSATAVSFEKIANRICADKDIIWAPIRHHSPQCSGHIQQLIKQEKPDIVLVEGPSEANQLIPHLCSDGARLPLSIFLYAVDKKNHWHAQTAAFNNLGSAAPRFRAHVPFASISPEWNALNTAGELNIATEFIDLPYAHRLQLNPNRDFFSKTNDALLYGDELMARSDPVAALLKQSHCRDFDDWWDRYFESGVYQSSANTFFRNMLNLSLVFRHGEVFGGHIDEETLAREAFMAQKITKYRQQGKRCLVVCGGYHCLGIHHFISHPMDYVQAKVQQDIDTGVHLVPYSMDRLNKATGYAAGLPDCGYYEQYWSKANTLSTDQDKSHLYSTLNTELSLDLFKALKKRGLAVSMPDVIESSLMCERLAMLRGHYAGRNELRDSVASCFLKNLNDGSEKILTFEMNKLLAGKAVGHLPEGLPVVPLVESFREQCRKYQLPLSAFNNKEKSLNIYRSERHREISRFFHQLSFLDIDYARLIGGPNFVQGKNLDLVRETWKLTWSPDIEPSLIEKSHLGTNLSEATLNAILAKLYHADTRGPSIVSLLLSALCSGLHALLGPIAIEIKRWLHDEKNILSLCEGLHQLVLFYNVRAALGTKGFSLLEGILKACFERMCIRLTWVGAFPSEQSQTVTDAISSMYNLVCIETEWCDAELFYDSLRVILEMRSDWRLVGTCTAILYRSEALERCQVEALLTEAFSFAALSPECVGQFIQGFLQVARSLLVAEPSLLTLITNHIMSWDEEAFLSALPAMRLAFTHLSPRETRALAAQLDQFGQNLLVANLSDNIPESELIEASKLRSQLNEALRCWGVTCSGDVS